MKPRALVVLLTLGLIALIGSASAARDGPVRGMPDDREIAAQIQPLIDDGSYVGIVVGIVTSHGRRVFTHGRISRDQSQEPTGKTVFGLASISKIFTGALLADLMLRGIVRLDDPVTKYLPPDLIKPNSPLNRVTLLDLATHMSGLPRMPPNAVRARAAAQKGPYSVRQMYNFLSRYRSARPPGKEFLYSNIGVALLGHILERASGIPYEQLLQERICEPLGMNSTRTTLDASMRQRLAQGYDGNLKPVELKLLDVGKGSGGVYSTAHDMMNFLAANMGLSDARIVPALLEAQRPRRSVPGKGDAFMGLTWHVKKVGNRQITSKNGGMAGFQSFIAFSKADQTGIIALANTSPKGRKLDAAARKILRTLLGGADQ